MNTAAPKSTQPLVACALCGLEVQVQGFSVHTLEGEQIFCCAGCLSVYRLLNGDKIID